jgi:hypothetical protein
LAIKTYQEIIEAFPRLSLADRSDMRRVLELQREKRASDGGWVPPMDLGGTSRNSGPRKVLIRLAKEGFLETTRGTTGRIFNGMRYRVPSMPANYSLPSEEELNPLRASSKGRPAPF